MLIGYARVSTEDQNLELQKDALEEAGCERLIFEKISGAAKTLPERNRLLDIVREDDVVVVWKLDRLGRSMTDLVRMVTTFQERGVGFRSLREAIDTTTAAGKLTFHIFASLAEFERDLIRERTQAGLAAARRRGAKLGRPNALTAEQIQMGAVMMADPAITAQQVAEQLGVHRTTLYRALRGREVPASKQTQGEYS